MIRRVIQLMVAGALAGGAAAPVAPAQNGSYLARGVRAYENVELQAAAALLRQALAESLATADRLRALTYLGATEVVGGAARRDSALAAFRRLLLLEPRHRPDPLVFPPHVLSVFDEARRATKAVRVAAPPETRFRPGDGAGGGAFVAALYGTSFHEIEVRIVREDGAVVRTLYVGPMGDSLQVRWDGLDANAASVRSGRYVLSVASRPSPGRAVVRVVQVPLHTELAGGDTLPLLPPLPDSLLKPERVSRGAGFASLAAGLLVGGAALALPPLIADGTKASGTRFAVGGAVTLAGIVGFVTQPAKVRRRNVEANLGMRAAWQRRLDSLRAENVRRRAALRLTVRAGAPTVIEAVGEGR